MAIARRYGGTVDGVASTVPIAEFETWPDADVAAAVLRESGIKCAIMEPPPKHVLRYAIHDNMPGKFAVVVATEDEAAARAALAQEP